MTLTSVYERSGKSFDLKDADGRLVGIVFLESDAKEICGAVNGLPANDLNGEIPTQD